MPLDVLASKTRAFEDQLRLWGTRLEYNGVPYPCIAPPIERMKKMAATGYDGDVTATFTMRSADFKTAGITTRAPFKSRGDTFELHSDLMDDTEPTVELRAFLRQ